MEIIEEKFKKIKEEAEEFYTGDLEKD